MEWNDAIVSHFFNPDRAGSKVWLDATEEVISEIGSTSGEGVPEFVAAMKAGPPWPTPEGLCQRALKTCEAWRARALDYPPYVGYLTLFVLAAGLEGRFASHAYYPRLRVLLGESPVTGQLPSFDRMYELWDDLERWSVHDLNGDLGLLEARIAGGMFHIGLPLGQSVLTSQDRRGLPTIFARAGFEPTSIPSDDEIVRALRTHGADLLHPRTVRIIERGSDSEKLAALTDLAAEELGEWNGEFVPMARDASATVEVHVGLRLSMRLNRVVGEATVGLRCILNRREFPEDGLSIELGAAGTFRCNEEVPGWSTPLSDANSQNFDASNLDWIAGCSAAERRLGWRFRLPPASVRVLVSGEAHGLPGLIEIPQLVGAGPFYVLFHERERATLETWGRTACAQFEAVRIGSGLSPAWNLAYVSGVSIEATSPYRSLMPPERVSLRLVGGVRSAPGNNFFSFTPPQVELTGGNLLRVRCNGELLRPEADGITHQLPSGLPAETRILVEAVTPAGDVRKRASLYLSGEFSWNRSQPLELFDGLGNPAPEQADDLPRAGGALVEGSNVSPFKPPVLLTTGLREHLERRIFFVGRRVGEIGVWPGDGVPRDWDPVWAIPMGRRGLAIFCGNGVAESAPVTDPIADSDAVRAWQDLLWHRRKRITPPTMAALAALWRRYLEAARDA